MASLKNYLWPNLSARSEEIELMDTENCDQQKLEKTLLQFKTLNFLFSRNKMVLKKNLLSEIREKKSGTFKYLEIGIGDGQLLNWLAGQTERLGCKLELYVVDRNPYIISHLKRRDPRLRNVNCLEMDALELGKSGLSFDYCFANHFLHHLPQEKLPEFMESLSQFVSRMFLFNDLARKNWTYLGYTVFAGIFLHRSFSYYDGRLSVAKGFRKEELDPIKQILSPDWVMETTQFCPGRILIKGRRRRSRMRRSPSVGLLDKSNDEE